MVMVKSLNEQRKGNLGSVLDGKNFEGFCGTLMEHTVLKNKTYINYYKIK